MKKLILILLVLFGLQSRAQVDWCDSLYYTTVPSPVFSVVGNYTSGVDAIADTVSWAWTVCNSSLCFSEPGTYASFPLIQASDTIKVCYNAYIATIPLISCTERCDSLVFDGSNWVTFPINTVGVTEVPLRIVDSKSYDLMGRELYYIPNGMMYIRNQKLHMKK